MAFWLTFGVRQKLLIWLALVIVPIAFAGAAAVRIIDVRLTDRIEKELLNARRLEVARLSDAVDHYRRDAERLAAGRHVREFLGGVLDSRRGEFPSDKKVAGYDGFPVIDPQSSRPLQTLTEALMRNADSVGSETVEVSIRDNQGNTLGETADFSWQPYNAQIVTKSIEQTRTLFGSAFRTESGDHRLGVVTPVFSKEGKAIGALLLETRLGPIVDLVEEHEGFGETSEAHIAQPTAGGDAELITLLRFERDAAFNKIVPKSRNLPINWSLESLGGRLVRSPDYRSIDSILAIETLPSTGWGVVVKIDAEEAFAPVAEVKNIVILTGLIVSAVILLGWILFLHPIGLRLKKSSLAAERVANGDLHTSIGDKSTDEIGEMARSIDKLAQELLVDIEKRSSVERQLRHQAAHDELTGLYNRKHGNALVRQIDESDSELNTSVLFLDLDGFKSVNDTFGHGAGDDVLIAVANRLKGTLTSESVLIRWGGDEFVMLLKDTDHQSASIVAERVTRLFDEPMSTESGYHKIGCSLGVATTNSTMSLNDALHEADLSMYAQKEMRQQIDCNYQADETEFTSTAARQGLFEICYEPIFTADVNNRWGIPGAVAAVLPGDDDNASAARSCAGNFEKPERSAASDALLVSRSLEDLANWIDADSVANNFFLSLKLCNASLNSEHLVQTIKRSLEQFALPGKRLCIQIAADCINPDARMLMELRQMGVRLSMDALGNSCSNLDRLVDLKPDLAIIDKRWSLDAAGNEGGVGSAILTRVLEICSRVGVDVIAKGIDSNAQISTLRNLGIVNFQGPLFCESLTATEFVSNWCLDDGNVIEFGDDRAA